MIYTTLIPPISFNAAGGDTQNEKNARRPTSSKENNENDFEKILKSEIKKLTGVE